MPEAILTILKFCFLALLYLFLARVVRVVHMELGGRRGGNTAATPSAPPARGRPGRRAGKALRLRVVAPPESRGQVFDIGEELTMGRAATCGISLDGDHYVSQVHARVYRRDGTIFVEDLGSTNGTYLNRKRLTYAMPVKRGDQIQVGKTVLEVSK